ncbi:DUF928 domain-containing protein [Oculatella sp. FACHB-28]|uniref:DUF928 domain-containing protein n=1 Tax=Oculatella sp. FACHB-28 TaxID=2692845 RepID=UPI0016864B52|nr:DUF928 domain-containing protein [Oculatella sp. FACHB-28]
MTIDFTLPPAQASSLTLTSLQTKQVRGQVPGRRGGGARRGDCPAPSIELTALVPMTEVPTETLPETYVGGSTTVEYPTFWFYVPYLQTANLSAEFILQNDTGQDVYRITSADLPAFEHTPGIISISLPSTIAPLEIGRVYQWYFKLNCGTEAPMYVQGGIERIPLDPDLAYQLAHASPQERVNLYLENDIWYDAITMLAQLHRINSSNTTIESAWINLLQSIGLENIPTD